MLERLFAVQLIFIVIMGFVCNSYSNVKETYVAQTDGDFNKLYIKSSNLVGEYITII
jgi:hypothetical protein